MFDMKVEQIKVQTLDILTTIINDNNITFFNNMNCGKDTLWEEIILLDQGVIFLEKCVERDPQIMILVQ